MQYFLYAILFIIFRAGIAVSHRNAEAEQFLRHCHPLSRCGKFDVKFPLSLDTSPSYCSPPGTQLSCIGNNTLLLSLPRVGSVEVTAINYHGYDDYISLKIKFTKSSDACPLQKLSSINLTMTPYYTEDVTFVFLNCTTNITLSNSRIEGPFLCLSNKHHFVYLASASESILLAAIGCDVVQTGAQIPDVLEVSTEWETLVESFIHGETYLGLPSLEGLRDCDGEGKHFIYSHVKNKVYCLRGSNIKLILGLSIGGLVACIVVVAGILYYKLQKSFKEKEVLQKVEKFLENYSSTAPTRYSYAEVIKIANRFKHKLGQGGYGSVYKGELSNGIPVAVKVLEKFIGEGEEFINEVSTIGRIHHFNIVRLLGFCSEGSRRALVYEFLPNKSLEKHIFSRETNAQKPLRMKTIHDIAIGIARGIEYLHQGCDQRILHFDIKPHNILLDYNFKPKIADFGLAKLCSKEQSIVTMTAVRGTMGYIAPELYSRNFGTVSYKSDVFSFGMLLLEMTGRRRNIDPDIENQSQVYFPEWVYDKLVHDEQEFKVILKINEEEEFIVKKLVTVALWCIQWSPTERPSMTKVLQMLIDNSLDLQIPPKPFVSSFDLT